MASLDRSAGWDAERSQSQDSVQERRAEIRHDIRLYRVILLALLDRHSADMIPIKLDEECLVIKRQLCVSQKVLTPRLVAESWERSYVWDRASPMIKAGIPVADIALILFLSALKAASTSTHEYGDIVKAGSADSRKRCHANPLHRPRTAELQPPESVLDVAAELWKLKLEQKRLPSKPATTKPDSLGSRERAPLASAEAPAARTTGCTHTIADADSWPRPSTHSKQRRKRGTTNFSMKLLRQISPRVLGALLRDCHNGDALPSGLPPITSAQLIEALQKEARSSGHPQTVAR